jgi:hypothetical protein
VNGLALLAHMAQPVVARRDELADGAATVATELHAGSSLREAYLGAPAACSASLLRLVASTA